MGVVRERKVVCEVASNTPSNAESTVNSGYVTAESEDEENAESRRLPRQPLRTPRGINLNFNLNITRHSGKRKVRRVLNSRFLETLLEENEFDNVMENNKSKFQILMEVTNDAIEYLEAFESQDDRDYDNDMTNADCEKNRHPYLRIPRKIRAAISSRKNFQYELLKSIEAKMAECRSDFFYYPDTCYERLLVHAVARYKGFSSETIKNDDKKAVKIKYNQCSKDLQLPLLCDYIEEMRENFCSEAVAA